MHYDTEAISQYLTSDNPDPSIAAHLCVCEKCRSIYERMHGAAQLLTSENIATGITLMPSEWIYCAALIGGETFEGMPDVLRRSDDKSRDTAYNKAMSALTDKSLIEVSFDGSIGIKKRLYDIVNICVNFDRFLSLTRRTPGKPERICNVYEKDGDSVVMYIDMKKGCTAVRRYGKVFTSDMSEDNQCGWDERYTFDELRALYNDTKGFGAPDRSEGTKAVLQQAMSGSAEYYSVTEIVPNTGSIGHLRSDVQINTYETGFMIIYEPEEKVYAVCENDSKI